MKNYWLDKNAKPNQKFLDEARKIEQAWFDQGGYCGLWDWQQNAVAIYLEGQRLSNEQKKSAEDD
jgi:hypothetical protein